MFDRFFSVSQLNSYQKEIINTNTNSYRIKGLHLGAVREILSILTDPNKDFTKEQFYQAIRNAASLDFNHLGNERYPTVKALLSVMDDSREYEYMLAFFCIGCVLYGVFPDEKKAVENNANDSIDTSIKSYLSDLWQKIPLPDENKLEADIPSSSIHRLI